MRDSEKTKAKIIAAVGKLLGKKGFSKVGINAIAREAGVDKVLIYRYFGGLQKLLRSYARGAEFWPSIKELLGDNVGDMKSPVDFGVALLKGHLRELLKRPITQEVMRWELHERNELTDELAEFRENQGLEIMKLLPMEEKKVTQKDVAAVAAIIHAGITYLVLRSKTADVYLGVDLTEDDGWERISQAIERMLRSYLD